MRASSVRSTPQTDAGVGSGEQSDGLIAARRGATDRLLHSGYLGQDRVKLKVDLATRIVALWLVAGIAISWPLWGTARSFPHLPPLDFLPMLPGPAEQVLALALLLALAFTVVGGPVFPVAAAAVGVLLLLLALDQMRWQPWVYQGLALLVALAILPGRRPSNLRRQLAIDTGRLILAAMYVWGGVQKLTEHFAPTYAWFLQPVTNQLAPEVQTALVSAAAASAWLEVATGILLLFGPARWVGVILALATHLLILFVLGPWGHNWNVVVWPWNLALIVLVLILFGIPDQRGARYAVTKESIPFAALAALFVVFPLFSLVGRWDCYLSFCLYSGNTATVSLHVTENVLNKVDPQVGSYARPILRHSMIDLNTWSFETMNVPVYPEPRVGEAVGRYFCARAEHAEDVVVDIVPKADLFGRRPPATRLDCSALGS